MDDLKYIEKLQQEQDRVLRENKDAQAAREKLKEDYLKLQTKLQTLPETISEDAMVPIGNVGFFPGRLIHTNEITVLLGDNWFIERSAKESIEIVKRRIDMVDKQLSDLQKEYEIIKSYRDSAEEFKKTSQGSGDIREIKEELPHELGPIKKGKSRKAHKAKHDLVPRNVTFKDADNLVESIPEDISQINSEVTIDHDELFAKLNQLEKEEQEEEERIHVEKMKKICEGNYDAVFNSHESLSDDDMIRTNKRHVKFRNDSKYSAVKMSYDSDSEQESSNNMIRFNHTPYKQIERSSSESNLVQAVNSPADIYNKFASTSLRDPDEKPLKSILKKDSRSNSSENLRLKPILKTSPEHQSGTSESFLDDPKPILKTPPDSQGSDRRPGTPEYMLNEDPKSILKVSNVHPYAVGSDFDAVERRPILKSPEMQLNATENLTENIADETRSILKSQGDINPPAHSAPPADSCRGFNEENRKTILKSQPLSPSTKSRNETAERKPILKNHINEAVSEQVVERNDNSINEKDSSKPASNKRPISKFKASRKMR